MNILNQIKSKLNKVTFEKLDSSEYQNEWYKENFGRYEAENYLNNFNVGGFVVRKSESIKNAYVLSVKVPIYINTNLVNHYIIIRKKNVVKIKGKEQKEFKNIQELINYCSINRNVLPVQLDCEFYESKIHLNCIRSASVQSFSSNSSDFCDLDDL